MPSRASRSKTGPKGSKLVLDYKKKGKPSSALKFAFELALENAIERRRAVERARARDRAAKADSFMKDPNCFLEPEELFALFGGAPQMIRAINAIVDKVFDADDVAAGKITPYEWDTTVRQVTEYLRFLHARDDGLTSFEEAMAVDPAGRSIRWASFFKHAAEYLQSRTKTFGWLSVFMFETILDPRVFETVLRSFEWGPTLGALYEEAENSIIDVEKLHRYERSAAWVAARKNVFGA